MSVQISFPGVIVFPDGTIRLVTRAAKDLAYANTNIAKIFSLSTKSAVPDYLMFDPTIPQMFVDAGFTVKWERQPVEHYRARRRRWSRAATSKNATVIDFLERIPDEYRNDAMCRAYGGHRQRNHRVQKVAEKRKRQEKQQDKESPQ